MISKLNKLLAGVNLGLMAGMVAMGIYLYFKVLPGRSEKVIYETKAIEIPFPLVEKKVKKVSPKKVEKSTKEEAKKTPSAASEEEPPPPIPINPEGVQEARAAAPQQKPEKALTIHVGDFRSRAEAEKAISLVKAMGLEPVVKKTFSKVVLTRVMAGPFKRKELHGAKSKILKVFPRVFLIKRKEGYYIHVGSFGKKEECEKAKAALSRLGFKVKTEEVEIKKTIYSIDAGRFTSFKDAQTYIEKLKEKGFDAFVIPIKS